MGAGNVWTGARRYLIETTRAPVCLDRRADTGLGCGSCESERVGMVS